VHNAQPSLRLDPASIQSDAVARICIAIAFILGLFARWFDLGSASLWFDEGFSVWTASQSTERLLDVVAADTNPPGHYLALHLWIRLFGDSEWAVRSLSALFSSIALLLGIVLARHLLQSLWAVAMASLLLALGSIHLQHGRDARMYAMLACFTMLAVCCLVSYRDRPSIAALAGYILATAASLWTHNAAIFYWFAACLTWFILPSETGRLQFKSFLAANAAIVLLFAPWMPTLADQASRVGRDFWLATPAFVDVVHVITTLASTDLNRTMGTTWPVHSRLPELLRPGLLLYAVPVAFAIGAGLLTTLFGRVDPLQRQTRIAIIAYAAIPTGVVLLLSYLSKPIWLDRALIASAPMFMVIVASVWTAHWTQDWMKTRAFRLIAYLAAGMTTLFVSLGSVDVLFKSRFGEDWRGAQRELSSVDHSGRTVVYLANEGQILIDYYNRRTGAKSIGRSVGLPSTFTDATTPQAGARLRSVADFRLLQAMLETEPSTQFTFVLTRQHTRDPERRFESFAREYFHGTPELKGPVSIWSPERK
jgi:uncharacterized membrane protein